MKKSNNEDVRLNIEEEEEEKEKKCKRRRKGIEGEER